MAFSSWRGVVGMINPTMRPGMTEEVCRLLPEGIGLIPLFLNISRGTEDEFQSMMPHYEKLVAVLAEQGCDIIHPNGAGPRIWFQVVPDRKTVSNRLHLDIHASGGRDLPIETRKKRVDAEARRLCDLGATLLSDLSEELEEGLDHYAVALRDPEGNEFDIN